MYIYIYHCNVIWVCEKFGGPVYKFSGVVSPLSVKTLEHKHNCSYVFAGYIRSLSCWTLALGIQWTTRQLLNFQSKIVAHLEINNIWMKREHSY